MNGWFEALVALGPWPIAMVCLVVLSAFFSASETALFYLSRSELRSFRRGSRREQVALDLLKNPNRLLTAVLFWNLVVNMTYFALSSIVAVHIEHRFGGGSGGLFGLATLVALIFFGEAAPKSVAVILRSWLARRVSIPLSLAVRAVDPLAPALKIFTVLSRRLFWPHVEMEPYLTPEDLERAIAVSTSDRALVETERILLDNILDLSEIRADELMRPRSSYRALEPPVLLANLGGEPPPSGYVLIAGSDGDELVGAVPLHSLSYVPERNLEYHAEKPVFVPWCAPAARVLEEMLAGAATVAGVVDEYGTTIGVITFEDLLDSVLSKQGGRTERLLRGRAIQQVAPGSYHVEGTTTLRRIAAFFDLPFHPGGPPTLAGYLHQELQRLPQPGDTCRWEHFDVRVIREIGRGRLLLELAARPEVVQQEGKQS